MVAKARVCLYVLFCIVCDGFVGYCIELAIALVAIAGFVGLSIRANGAEPYQIATPKKLAAFHAMLPPTVDAELIEIFSDPATLWYDEFEMPLAYQHDGSTGIMSMHWARYNLGPDEPSRRDPFGNGNLEWPWFDPSVLDNRDGRVKSFKGLRLPRSGDGRLPVVVYKKAIPSKSLASLTQSYTRYGFAWVFPVGTNFVEVLTNRVNRNDVAFKVLRMERQSNDWFRKIYRPFPTLTEYETAIGQRVQVRPETRLLRDPHPTPTFVESRSVAILPPISPVKTLALLRSTPFRECLGESFTSDVNAPTTMHDGQIVPRGYLGVFFGPDQSDCRNCHRDTLSHVSVFDPPRDWYGVIRGSDEVFSFHPFDPRCLSRTGVGKPVQLCPKLVYHGIVAWYDQNTHRPPHYGPIR